LTFIVCLCLVSVCTAQMYSQGVGSYGYPGAYGNIMGSNYMGAYSPYSSPYGMNGMSGMSGSMGGMNGMSGMSGMSGMIPGQMGGMNSMYGHSLYGNRMGLGSYGMGAYGSPYSQMGQAYVGRSPFYYSPLEPFSMMAAKKAKKA